MLRAGIYNRCSTEEEAQINALETQVAESREIVVGNGWIIADQYVESESGTTSHKRSEYQRLMGDLETDKFDIVVIKSIDRLMRSARDWYIFVDKLSRNNKKLYIYIDRKFYTPDDSLITGIKAILAEDFSRELSKKIKNAHKRRQSKKSGLNITSPMFGWDKVGKNSFVINEREAASYRLAFELAREGMGFYRISKMMFENGVRSKRGKRMDETQWRNMLYSPRAHGTVVLHTTEYDFEAKRRVKLPESEWIYVENALPPIVSREYQAEVLQMLEARGSRMDAPQVDYAQEKRMKECHTREGKSVSGLYDLSGKLYCAVCGKVYYRVSFKSGGSTLNEWKCSTMLSQGRKTKGNTKGCNNINILEDVVFEKVEEAWRQYHEKLPAQAECLIRTRDGEEMLDAGKPDGEMRLGGNFPQMQVAEEMLAEETLTMIRKVLLKNNKVQELQKLQKEAEKLEKKKQVLLTKLMEEVIGDDDFKAANQRISEMLEVIREKIRDIKSGAEQEINCEERMEKIREALYGGVIRQAKAAELMKRIDKIVIHPDNRLEIISPNIHTFIAYEHKTNIVRKREQMKIQILELFRENPGLMLKEVPEMIGMSKSFINSIVRELKEEGLLKYERNGNTHTGRWIADTDTVVGKYCERYF